jgi:ADP-ribose pyrophosphatase YjhB (NUDIX family)
LTWQHEGMNTPMLREAARAVLLDHDDRIMLLRYEENGGFWATPGGSLEEGESHGDAVVRELAEELGQFNADLGPVLATRTKDHLVGGQPVRQVELYYLVRAATHEILPETATRTDNIRVWRWWTLPELRDTDQTVYPVGLGTLIEDLLESGEPAVPHILA